MIGTAHLLLLGVLGMLLLVLAGIYMRPTFPEAGLALIIVGFCFPFLTLVGLGMAQATGR